MNNVERIHISRLQANLIEAIGINGVPPNHVLLRVVIDAETGETVSSNVPVGSHAWRRLARAARNWQ